ncbi:MAG: diguanylate cyclase [Peptococcaceae bacterium]|nr:diguanylate cyclase [Peptococcaceae bacterium]MDH7525916.1 diguanylate cyclase [Peptococcaceae bacterium]
MPSRGKPKLFQVLQKWFLLIGYASVLLSLVIFLYLSYSSIKEFAFLNLQNSCEQQSMMINGWFRERAREIDRLSVLPALRRGDAEEIKETFAVYKQRVDAEFDSYYFAGKNGFIVTGAAGEDILLYVGDRGYFKAAVEGKSCTSEVLTSRIDGQPVVVVCSPVYSEDNEVSGAVLGTLSLSRVDDFVSSFHFGQTGETYLVNESGLMLTESRFTQTLTDNGLANGTTKYSLSARSRGVDRVINGENGTGEYLNYRQVPVLGAYRWLPERGWGLVVEIEKGEVVSGWLKKVLPFLAVFLAAMTMSTYFLARRMAGKIVAPLAAITRKVGVFSENYKSDVLSWFSLDSLVYEEFALLSEAFSSMGERIQQLMENLESEAQYDPLTRLPNRLYFFKRGEQVLELVQRKERVCSLVFLDIDYFKKVNDTYGHAIGDLVLIHLARILESNVRISDIVARLGGEEFTIILPDTDLTGARMLAERLRKKIYQTPVKLAEESLTITVSMGIAAYFGTKGRIYGNEVLENLIKKADAAMYLAKQKGRNRVEIFAEEADSRQLRLFLDEDGDVV